MCLHPAFLFMLSNVKLMLTKGYMDVKNILSLLR